MLHWHFWPTLFLKAKLAYKNHWNTLSNYLHWLEGWGGGEEGKVQWKINIIKKICCLYNLMFHLTSEKINSSPSMCRAIISSILHAHLKIPYSLSVCIANHSALYNFHFYPFLNILWPRLKPGEHSSKTHSVHVDLKEREYVFCLYFQNL